MFDINFYMQSHSILRQIDNGKKFSKVELFNHFERLRSKEPIVYNIETTNACNMRCKMCPRTSRMTRNITFLESGYYQKVVEQIKPHNKQLWNEWENFCTKTYGIAPNSEPIEITFSLCNCESHSVTWLW